MTHPSLDRVRQALREAGVDSDRLWSRIFDAAAEEKRGQARDRATPTLHELKHARRVLREAGSDPDRLWERVFTKVFVARLMKEFTSFSSSRTEKTTELIASCVNDKAKTDLPLRQGEEQKTETRSTKWTEN